MDVGIIGAGIVGLTLARALTAADPTCRVTVLEKEAEPGRHQTSHNSGVVHAGLYYKPGSLKARLCSRGRGLLRDYCQEKGLPFKESGKLVVAVDAAEIAGLREIHRRATENGVPDLRWLEGSALTEIEPHVRGVAAVYSPRTGVVDFPAVVTAIVAEFTEAGGQVRTNSPVSAIRQENGRIHVIAGKNQHHVFDRLVVCAGLQSDRVSQMAGGPADPQIVPFLGMYYRLVPERRHLVRSLIYPVPDPRYPFLGVHLTRTVHDDVLVGPNALLGLAREGYRAARVNLRDLGTTLRWPGFYRLAGQHWRAGARELVGALSRRAFVAAARRYVPELSGQDVVRAGTGVRAQAVAATGALVDDFALVDSNGVLSVRNAPSPAATSSFAIAEYLVPKVLRPE